MQVLSWNFLSISRNGLDIGCSVKIFTRLHVRSNRPISFSSLLVSEGIEIRHGCQFISSLVRALAKLPGGMGRFLHVTSSWGGIDVLMVSLLGHWNLVTINALVLPVGFWGILGVQQRSFLTAP